MNKKEAEELSVLLMQVSGKLDQSVRFVMDKDTKENFESYRSNAGKVSYGGDFLRDATAFMGELS
jgi:hypothetical protein